jgi:hypothetical protein
MIKIGKEKNYISIDVLRRNDKGSNDYWDANWLTTKISVCVGAWQGSYQAELRVEEFIKLKEELEKLYKKLDYTFELRPMEPWVILKFSGSKTGQIEVQGEACDTLGIGNTLKFLLEIDQTCLPKIIENLKEINNKFPIKGKP